MIDPVLAIFLRKELRDLRGNTQVLPGYLLLPLVAVVLPVIMLATFPTGPSQAADPDIVALYRIATRDPLLAGYPEAERLSRLVIREFGAFFLLMPVILSSMSAALSIAAEKQQRTLEPILATPLSDREFLLAKLVAAVVPAVVVTWAAALLYGIAIAIVTAIRFGDPFLPGPAFPIGVLVLAPLIGVAAALVGMRASIRAVDIQGAVQAASLWVLPGGLVLVGLVGRLALQSPLIAAIVAPAGAGLVVLLFRRILIRFAREDILTRWK